MMSDQLQCVECGNTATQPIVPVESELGHTYSGPDVFCANGHRPLKMLRVATYGEGRTLVSGEAPGPGS